MKNVLRLAALFLLLVFLPVRALADTVRFMIWNYNQDHFPVRMYLNGKVIAINNGGMARGTVFGANIFQVPPRENSIRVEVCRGGIVTTKFEPPAWMRDTAILGPYALTVGALAALTRESLAKWERDAVKELGDAKAAAGQRIYIGNAPQKFIYEGRPGTHQAAVRDIRAWAKYARAKQRAEQAACVNPVRVRMQKFFSNWGAYWEREISFDVVGNSRDGYDLVYSEEGNRSTSRRARRSGNHPAAGPAEALDQPVPGQSVGDRNFRRAPAAIR